MTKKTHLIRCNNAVEREILDKIADLESICSRDVGRGIQPLVKRAKGGLLGAARSIAEHDCPNVAIITGFFMPNGNPPCPETDGIIGCALLAASLLEVGIAVRIVTDSLCYQSVKTAIVAAGIFCNIPFDIVAVGKIRENQHSIASLLEFWKSLASPISHIISIERAGPGKDGIVRNMRGEDITAYTAPLHFLLKSENIISVGIGDGGNELGMGNIPKGIIASSIRDGEKIRCTIKCDYLIVCGVSNWGAAGILLALSLLRPDWKATIIHKLNPQVEFHILETLMNQGLAIDGIKGIPSLSVDNLSWEFHAEVLKSAIQVVS
ncbi:DUF4392 domain-containing protein [Plectonema cf. radiosum LEGE 06105]|uniref:DUF4392 domain-containing protein n=1 Tax=Plectonema cf. radiosum LEGE 06105 TaxID=945769 RepID=A0A8J7F687_9CYAN|nr:DUF4392 domain-containing protein [Plectonema radiosum]MBE9215313.1 DUF4392 domain-containing protein [Plectonema cf. radiosum LEGE 06105]